MDNTVYYNLEESPFFVEIDDIKFYFSSENRKTKFLEKYKTIIENENSKVSVRYNNIVNFELLWLFYCYKRTENRGFYIEGKVNEKWVKLENYYFKCNLVYND